MPPDRALPDSVDDVLEAAWPVELRRARIRLVASMLQRVVGFLAALVLLALAMWLAFGLILPWTFFAFMAILATVAVSHESDRSHLRRTPETRPCHRPSTGCYPGRGEV